MFWKDALDANDLDANLRSLHLLNIPHIAEFVALVLCSADKMKTVGEILKVRGYSSIREFYIYFRGIETSERHFFISIINLTHVYICIIFNTYTCFPRKRRR